MHFRILEKDIIMEADMKALEFKIGLISKSASLSFLSDAWIKQNIQQKLFHSVHSLFFNYF